MAVGPSSRSWPEHTASPLRLIRRDPRAVLPRVAYGVIELPELLGRERLTLRPHRPVAKFQIVVIVYRQFVDTRATSIALVLQASRNMMIRHRRYVQPAFPRDQWVAPHGAALRSRYIETTVRSVCITRFCAARCSATIGA